MKNPTIRRFLWYLFAVPHCAACRALLAPEEALRGSLGGDVLCTACRAAWEQEKLALCPTCGEAAIDCRCMPVLLTDAGADCLLHLGEYRADSAVGRVILRLKDTALRRAADFAAAQLLSAVRRVCSARNVAPEMLVVTYLPRSKRARREHGHDQAELVAQALAKRLGASFVPLLCRAEDGAVQKGLTAAERQANVRTAFARAHGTNCAGRAVLLFDDVVTTGASMAEGVRILREAGAAYVFCAAIGLTVGK